MPQYVEAGAHVVEDIHFPGRRGRLHGRLAYPEEGTPAGAAVIAGPHPLLGGTMDNNVVAGVADGLARRGLLTLRFDYSGVGRSEGPRLDTARHLAEFWHTSHVPEEMNLATDVAAAAEYARRVLGLGMPLALIGYSFGCALLPAVCHDAATLALIGPTVGKHDYSAFAALAMPKLVIASEDDFASDAAGLREWFAGLAGPNSLVLGGRDNHFFRGQEEWLADTALAFLREHWGI
jgi:alpha/beta superfamily hydrolase